MYTAGKHYPAGCYVVLSALAVGILVSDHLALVVT